MQHSNASVFQKFSAVLGDGREIERLARNRNWILKTMRSWADALSGRRRDGSERFRHYNRAIGMPQNSRLPQSVQCLPIQTPSKCSIAG